MEGGLSPQSVSAGRDCIFPNYSCNSQRRILHREPGAVILNTEYATSIDVRAKSNDSPPPCVQSLDLGIHAAVSLLRWGEDDK